MASRSNLETASFSKGGVAKTFFNSHGWILLSGIVSLGIAASRAVSVRSDSELWVGGIFQDDAYYYLEIARNLADSGRSTFGHIVITNGYHPLWLGVLWLIRLVTPNGDLPLTAYYFQCIAFVVTSVLAFKLGTRLGFAPFVSFIASALAMAVFTNFAAALLVGMENSILMPLILGFLLLALPAGSGKHGGLLREIVLGIVASLTVLARLDSIILVFLVLVGRLGLMEKNVAFARTPLAVLGGVILAYLAFNRSVFGLYLPVSGEAKSVGGTQTVAERFVDYLNFGSIAGYEAHFGLVVTLGAGIALVVRSRSGRGRFSGKINVDLRSWSNLLLAVFSAQIAQLLYFGLTSAWSWWPWYFYYILIQGLLVLLMLTEVAFSVLHTSRFGWNRVAEAGTVVLFSAVILAGAIESSTTISTDGLRARTNTAIAWLRGNSDANDVLAVGDRAGYVGWNVDNPLIQMEGLVEDAGYLEHLRDGTLTEVLVERRARYLMAFGVAPNQGCSQRFEPSQGKGTKSELTLCSSQVVYRDDPPGKPGIQIWKF